MKKLFLFLFLPLTLLSQEYNSFNHNMYDTFSKELHFIDNTTHTSFKPFLFLKNDVKFSIVNTRFRLLNRFFNENFISVNTNNFK